MKKIIKIVLWFMVVCSLVGGGAYVIVRQNQAQKLHIETFHSGGQDEAFVRTFFTENWYWLVSEYSIDFSLDYILSHMKSSNRPDAQPLMFEMLYRGKKPIGFVAYYILPSDVSTQKGGKLLFLGVTRFERGKGYSSLLIRRVLSQLCHEGCSYVELVTRVHNTSARETYRKNGFYETTQDGSFVTYRYDCAK